MPPTNCHCVPMVAGYFLIESPSCKKRDTPMSILGVYVLTRQRTRALVEEFLTRYGTRPLTDDLGDTELQIETHERIIDRGITTVTGKGHTDPIIRYHHIPAISITHSVNLGLGDPTLAFDLVLDSHDSRLSHASIGFTVDGQLIVGLSFNDPDGDLRHELFAQALLTELVVLTHGHHGLIVYESAPSLSERAFTTHTERVLLRVAFNTLHAEEPSQNALRVPVSLMPHP